MMHKAWRSGGEVPYCFSRSFVKFQGHAGQKLFRFWPELSVSRLQLQFELIHGFEMTQKAWCSIEEVPYCFPRLSIKFQGHRGQQIANYDPKWAFPDSNFSLNSPMNLKAWCSIEEVTYYFEWKIDDLNPIWVRLLGRSQLSNSSDLPCSLLYKYISFLYRGDMRTCPCALALGNCFMC